MNFSFSATRRRFLFLGASLASGFGTAIATFGQQSTPSPKPSIKPRTDGFVPVVGPASILEKHGKVLTDKVLIVKNKANNKLVAVSPLCVHRNCVVDWQQETRLHPDDSDACGERSYRVLTTFQQYFEGQLSTYEQEYRLQHRNGNYIWVLCRGILVRDVWNKPYRMAGSHTDITGRKQAEEELRQSELQLKNQTQNLQQALKELQQTQMQLIHNEKMSSLGQLVAGIAHEINNPVNFIYGNLNYLEEYVQGLLNIVQTFQQCYPQPLNAVQIAMEKFELGFVSNDLPQLLNSMRVGSERIRDIVHSLRNFSRLDEAEKNKLTFTKELKIHY